MTALGIVLIGRNEGARLAQALEALRAAGALREGGPPVVYVDSGSQDDSVAVARAAGAHVEVLRGDRPFSAARARNAGFEALMARAPCDLVQFLDGDCQLVPGWLEAGAAALRARPELGLVTGWRAEIAPEQSLYNALAHAEWRRPAGPIRTCGGDMMVRAAAFREAGGFDPAVIAAEDDDFCLRLAAAGWRLERLPQEMTRHDAAMHHFGQWWRRAVRSGHGFAQVGHRHPDHFRAERRRVWLWGGAMPLLALFGLAAGAAWLVAGVALAYLASYLRLSARLRDDPAVHPGTARGQAALLVLSKLPNLLGMVAFHLRRWRGGAMRIIEYK